MKRQPTSHRDFVCTVYCVNLDDLSVSEDLRDKLRYFLAVLAEFADYRTGRRVHPGYEFLAAAMRCHSNTIGRYSKILVGAGILELTTRPDGKSVATEWRICIEKNAFPESYPSLKLVNGSSDLKSLDHNVAGDQDRDLKSALGHNEDGFRSQSNGQKHGLGHNIHCDPSTPLHPSPPSNPASLATMADKQSAKELRELLHWMRGRWVETNNSSKIRSRYDKETHRKTDEEDLLLLVEEYGSALVRITFEAFCIIDDLPSGWKNPLMTFVEQFGDYLARAEKGGGGLDALAKGVYEIRRTLCGITLQDWRYYPAFRETMTAEENAELERLSSWMKKSRDYPEKQFWGIALNHAGPLLRLNKRGKEWMAANPELVAKHDREVREWQDSESQKPVPSDGDDEEEV